MDRDYLVVFLDRYGVPWQERWGRGKAKTLDHLLKELNEDDVALWPDEEANGLVRFARGIVLDVFWSDESGRYKLVEDRQVFADGRERRRNLSTSLGEKLKRGESPRRGALRALREELSISLLFIPGICEYEVRGPEPSESFPGLLTKYQNYHYAYDMLPEHFRKEGYVEVQQDKISYFEWHKF